MQKKSKSVITKPTKQFIELTKPYTTNPTSELYEALLILQLKGTDSYGVMSEIVKLQSQSILNEIASRN